MQGQRDRRTELGAEKGEVAWVFSKLKRKIYVYGKVHSFLENVQK